MMTIFSAAKSFDHDWIGHEGLNQWGLHAQRMLWAARCTALRRRLSGREGAGMQKAVNALKADGFVAVEDFLPSMAHAAILREIEAATEHVGSRVPIQLGDQPGYGSKQPFEGGFDRYDGGTLNRFITIDAARMPYIASFACHAGLSTLTRAIVGRGHRPHKTNIYLMVHGAEDRVPDLQKDFHRDTFFPAMKFWYFPKAVGPEDGPFTYVPGSHRLTQARLKWEHDMAMEAIETRAFANVGGSFRIAEKDLPSLGLPAPVAVTCPANTLVMANVLGFHRRGDAAEGRERLSLYGWHRPAPFLPL
ncbi:phytanoyl-CoA dioxygenase family protein [Kordiimonas marina]|uniref:phytanoyl-CoA dioxygenase family protein n=1 Tax=Kordiimonas marina TaxID=2872312 RepID=UPI001FF5C9C3|nr:phytanoyl-CoA dioxygenase family protein [Kordiimonas marina]MCJ9427798.1 phytanoyl-CoA dioxygenase family protein [Kordiimonas marina]